MTARRVVLPAMGLLLAAYAIAHSPALGAIGRMLGLSSRRCYFTCSAWLGGNHPGEAMAAMFLILAAVVAAWILSARLRPGSYERPLLFGVGVLAFSAVPSAVVGLIAWGIGAPLLRPPAGPLLASIPALGLIAVATWRGVWPRRPRCALPHVHGLTLVFAILAAVLLAVTVAVTLGHPPTGYDALSYHGPMAVYFWRDGSIGAPIEATPWAAALAHPGTAELWSGVLRVAAGERVASLAQLPFALLGSAAIYGFARRTGLAPSLSRVGALAFLLAPIVVLQSGIQVNDLAAGALVMTAMALAAAPPHEWTRSRFAVLGLTLGLAVTTKLAALPAAVAVLSYVVIGAVRERRLDLLGWLIGVGALVIAPWWIRNLVMFGNPIFPAALPLIGRGYVVGDFAQKDDWFVPSVWAWPLYPVLEPHNDMSGLGAVFAVGAIAGLGVAAFRAHRRAPLRLLGLTILVSVPAWWLLTQHEPRLMLGSFGLGFAFVGWALLGVPRHHRGAAAAVLVLAASISAIITIDQALLPRAREPNGRAEFYDRVWGIDSVVAGWAEHDPMLYHTGHARLSYAGDYPLLGPSLRRRLVVIDGVLPMDSIVGIMRRTRVRYAYVPAAASARAAVRDMYAEPRFELVHQSSIATGKSRGVGRFLFRLRAE